MVATAMKNLQEGIEDGLTPQSLMITPENDVKEMIKNVSFSNRKAGFLKGTAEMILSHYDGKIPISPKELLKLPGVGNKVASVFIAFTEEKEGEREVSSIGVDTHLARIFQRWGWTTETKPDKIAKDIQGWLPLPLWKDINQIVVGFGQIVCSSRNPLCNSCLARHWCPGKEEIPREVSSDIEDMQLLLKQTEKARNKLVEEYDLPQAEAEWISCDEKEFLSVRTNWLEEPSVS
jgi:endonuclease-3